MDKTDPFVVGQYLGMVTVLTFVENNNGIPKDFLEKLKRVCVEKTAVSLEKPEEDIYLMVDRIVEQIGEI